MKVSVSLFSKLSNHLITLAVFFPLIDICSADDGVVYFVENMLTNYADLRFGWVY